MSTREQLNQYLQGLEKRLRLQVISKGVAIALGVALGATLALVFITNALAFSDTSVLVARVVLFISLAVALGMALVIPLLRLNQRNAAGKAETACPEFQERLLTYVERREQRDPMLELLAQDTLQLAPKAPATRVVPQKSLFTFSASAGAAGAALLYLILAAPGYLGYGASLLWAGPPKSGSGPNGGFYQIIVEPGSKLVKRRSDVQITATLQGFQAPQIRLMAKYQSAAKWEEANMLPRASGGAYEFLFAALPEPVEYYVEAAGVKSKTFKLDVIDLPSVKKIKVTYRFPAWLGQKDEVEDPGGDLRAVVGTNADLLVETDKPLTNGFIELEDGSKIELKPAGGNQLTARVPIQRDGVYHFAAKENSESVRLSEDYFIEARLDEGPSVKITHPPSDARVSPIEEVSIEVQADDDFGISSFDLHYSVNGSKEKVVNLLTNRGTKSAEGKTTIALEEFNMVAGDVVAMYATAKDARIETKSDIVFVEAQAFEKNYSQSQQGGGGGGGGGEQEQNEISKRQKEIITATFNAIRNGPKDRAASKENADFLAEVQSKLKAQSESLAQRVTSRQLAGANSEFQNFTKEMLAAAAEMGPASTNLTGMKWQDAYEAENKALQHLRRAEETMRDIQVAFGQQGGGGGGGGGAGRDLANLFDLELDTEKNQYEQSQSGGSSSAEARQKEVDEALEKLQQLARRQQELANQSKNGKQSVEQRWQQEMLRREAEELKRQMEQMSQNGQQSNSQSSSQSSSSSSSSGQSGQSGQQGKQGKQGQQNAQQRAGEQRLQSALEQLKKATEDMRQAQQKGAQAGQSGQQSDAADARRAAERLKEAADQVSSMRRQDANSQLGDLGNRAEDLARRQHEFEDKLKQAFGAGGQDARDPKGATKGPGMSQEQARQAAAQEEAMLAELKKLEEDMQKTARQLAGQQPNASSRVREGISEVQQNDIKRRMEYSSEYIRRGMGAQIIQWQSPVTRALDGVKDKLQQAQEAMGQGNQQMAGATEAERQLNRLEQMRANLERAAGRGQQGQGQQGKQGQGQQGQGQQGKQGQGGQQGQGQQGQGQQGQQGQAGQQGGGQGQGNQQGANVGGGNQGGANQFGQFGGNNNGGGRFNGGDFGRYNPEGVFTPQDGRPVDPSQAVRDAARQLAEMRQAFKDNPDMMGQIQDLEQEIRRVNNGETSGPELQQRLSRTILPQLETLEVQLRRDLSEQQTGQVRSGTTDRVPPGFSEAVAEYWRKLNSTRSK